MGGLRGGRWRYVAGGFLVAAALYVVVGQREASTHSATAPSAGNPTAGNPTAGNPTAGNPTAGNPEASQALRPAVRRSQVAHRRVRALGTSFAT